MDRRYDSDEELARTTRARRRDISAIAPRNLQHSRSERTPNELRRCTASKCKLTEYQSFGLAKGKTAFKEKQIPRLNVHLNLKACLLDKGSDYETVAPWHARLIKLTGRRNPHHEDSSAVKPSFELELMKVDLADMDGVGITGTAEVVHYSTASYVWARKPLVFKCSITGIH